MRRRLEGGVATAAALAGAFVVLPAAGCAEEVVAVRLIVSTDLGMPDELDEVVVTIVAAKPDGTMCEPSTIPDPPMVGWPPTLPYEILVERGETYDFWVAFRVEGKLGGVTQHERQQLVRWPEEGVLDVPVKLQRLCRDRMAPCGPTEECIDGECPGLQSSAVIFTEPWPVDSGTPCFAVAE
ncbi:MAG: hypothetical protein QME96_06920 [Myxococcota bacterium]|nr:hypothetical protein [Myxococcota bacterium]